MKRARSIRSHCSQRESIAIPYTVTEGEYGIPYELMPPTTRLITPPPEDNRPSKVRRHGSRFLHALKSLTNSAASSTSQPEQLITPPQSPTASTISTNPSKRDPISFMKSLQMAPTVVHRQPTKPRVTLRSLEKSALELTAEASPATSSGETSGNSGKSSAPGNSTGKTSLDSKFSSPAKVLSGHFSENKKGQGCLKVVGLEDSCELSPIHEGVVEVTPQPIPTVVTVEKAAAAKIFFETHYNDLLSTSDTGRSIRRKQLMHFLNEDFSSSPNLKDERLRAWAQNETNHLREVRAMKSRRRGPKGLDQMALNYEVVKVLGKGSFGVVRLVREKVRNDGAEDNEVKRRDVYAMKVIRKTDMLRNSQEGHLRAERDFLVAAEGCRWVVPLVASFQDASNLYLIMDYMPGGDFLGLLIRDNILSEPVTKWYIAEMILCIEEAHALKWIHRDVKPDNFLISPSGHLKISDFGLAFDGHWSHDQSYFNNQRYSLLTKLGISVEGDSMDRKEGRAVAASMKLAQATMVGKERHQMKSTCSGSDSEGVLNWRNRTGNRSLARSVVGTSQYMAPEVVRGELYDARCDWWSVAIILYECLYGHTPFLAEEGGRQQTKVNIVKHQQTFAFPQKPAVSNRCQDLIRRIIQEKQDRLSSKRYRSKDLAMMNGNRDYAGRYVYANDAEEIKAHRWFKDIQWDRIHLMTPPFVPAIKSLDDTQYFDEEEPISDFSSSQEYQPDPPTEAEIDKALRCFNRETQIMAREFVTGTYDSVRLRKIEKDIEGFIMSAEQKEYLRGFVRAYGRKERKRPRDKLLRDRENAGKVLEIRRREAFLGYSYRRIRREETLRTEIGELSRVSGVRVVAANIPSVNAAGVNGIGGGITRGGAWLRGRLSIN